MSLLKRLWVSVVVAMGLVLVGVTRATSGSWWPFLLPAENAGHC